MTIVDIVIGIAVGFFLGLGAAVFYIRWKMRQQLGMMQGQMEEMFDLTSEMTQGLEEIDEEDLDNIELEEADSEKEKEEK